MAINDNQLHIALAKQGERDGLAALLAVKPELIDQPADEFAESSALIIAAQRGFGSCVELLLSLGAVDNKNACESHGHHVLLFSLCPPPPL